MNVIEFNSSVTEFQIIDKIIDSGKCIENVFSVILQILTKREHINCFIVSQQITTLTILTVCTTLESICTYYIFFVIIVNYNS